ncbi:MAG: hypothetical protein HUJ72_00385 [Blautia sp.]|nr:hypothetical protein [Blautia sp.]
MKHVKPLSETHPQLALEWSDRNFPFTPDEVTAGSGDHVWWIGACGHEWYATIQNRARNGVRSGTQCPYCTGRAVLKGFNDFASQNPELLPEWSKKNAPLMPEQFTSNSRQRILWVCSKGHEWETSISNRTNGNGCPVCGKEKVQAGINDLATTHPEIAAEWSEKNLPLTPDMVKANYKKQVIWQCRICGKEYVCQTYSRTHNKTICPHCRQALEPDPKTASRTENKSTKAKPLKPIEAAVPAPVELSILPESEICEDLKEGVHYYGQGKYKKHSTNMSDINQVPICEKYALTVEEASSYFQISVNKLRNVVRNVPNAPFLIHQKTQVFIMREAFESFLDELNEIPEVMT